MVAQSKQGFREVSPHTEEFGEFVRRLRHRWKVSLDDVVFYLPVICLDGGNGNGSLSIGLKMADVRRVSQNSIHSIKRYRGLE